MTVTELITEINYAHKGNNRAPVEGTDKWNRALSIINRKIREWATARNISWASRFEEYNLGAFSTTEAVNLPTKFHKLSDRVFVLEDDGVARREYRVVKPDQRRDWEKGNAVYVSGTDPKVLTFTATIATDDPLLGNSIIVPMYTKPDALTAGSDEVKIDSEEWLIYSVAAELARNDPAKDDQFGNLTGLANEKWQDMVANNDDLPYLADNSVDVSVQSVGETW